MTLLSMTRLVVSFWQCFAVFCDVVQCHYTSISVISFVALLRGVWQCVAVSTRVAACCRMLQFYASVVSVINLVASI